MAHFHSKERRFSTRRQLTGDLPGEFVVAGTGGVVSCQPVDISDTGLGIISEQFFVPGTHVAIRGDKVEIALEVVWRQDGLDNPDIYYYGLTVLDPELNLESLFFESGCLK